MKHLNPLRPDNLTEWEFFALRHKNTGNLAMHAVSFVTSFMVLWAAIHYSNFWILLLFPLTQYIGFLGHIIFDEGGARNRDFVSPWTTFYLIKIFSMIMLRKYSREIERIEAKLNNA